MEREKGFELSRRWVNYLKRDAPLPLIALKPFAFPVPSHSAPYRLGPPFGAELGHKWGTRDGGLWAPPFG